MEQKKQRAIYGCMALITKAYELDNDSGEKTRLVELDQDGIRATFVIDLPALYLKAHDHIGWYVSVAFYMPTWRVREVENKYVDKKTMKETTKKKKYKEVEIGRLVSITPKYEAPKEDLSSISIDIFSNIPTQSEKKAETPKFK